VTIAMGEDENGTGGRRQALDLSMSCGTVTDLLRSRVLDPPARPGVEACLDSYEVRKVIGAGGMGVVVLAVDRRTGRQVAIKVLKPEYVGQPYAVRRFLTEARHMQKLDHPNIVKVLEVSDRPEGPYFVMPYMARGSLADLLRPGEPADRDLPLQVASDIADALAHTHQRGITHRDLKPANILVGEDGRACLTDFGLARRTNINESIVDVDRVACEGTCPYMPPEVAAGYAGDTRCDIYSFGAVLYEMLAGKPPYGGESVVEVIKAIKQGPPKPILQLQPGADRSLATIADGAMGRELRERYASMSDVREDLERVASGARPQGPGRRRWRRRYRPLLAGVAAVAAAIYVGMAWWGLTNHRSAESPTGGSGSGPPGLTKVSGIAMPGVVTQWNEARLGEWDGDGKPELFVCNDTHLFVVSQDGQVLFKHRLAKGNMEELGLDMVRDFDGDGRAEVLVNWTDGEDIVLTLLNQNMYELRRFECKGSIYSGPGGQNLVSNAKGVLVEDLDGDKRRELLAILNTGYGRTPKAVLCYDFESGKLLWRHDTGGCVHDILATDLDGDGRKDIVFGTGAPGNGNVAEDGTDDSTAYVCALSHDGKFRWARAISGYSAAARILLADLDGNGNRELLAWSEATPECDHGPCPVVVLDSSGRITHRYDPPTELSGCLAVDEDRDGAAEVLVADWNGWVRVLDASLKPEQEAQVVRSDYEHVILCLHDSGDLDGDGRPEVILTSQEYEFVSGTNPGFAAGERNVRLYHNTSVLALDASLKVRSRYLLADTWKKSPWLEALISHRQNRLRPDVLVLGDRAVLLGWSERAVAGR